MPEYIVELLVVVEADSVTDATVLGERAQREAWQATTPRSANMTPAKVINVILADVRSADD